MIHVNDIKNITQITAWKAINRNFLQYPCFQHTAIIPISPDQIIVEPTPIPTPCNSATNAGLILA